MVNRFKWVLKRIMLFLIFGAILSCVSPPKEMPELAPIDPDSFQVIGYSTSWSGMADSIDFDAYTTINFSFAIPREDGSILRIENDYKLRSILEKAAEKDVKVFLAVGGWSYRGTPLDETFEILAANKDSRERFIEELIALCEEYQLDGIDLDWEYPGPEAQSSENFETLVFALSHALHDKGLGFSAAVPAGSWGGDAYSDKALACFDYINLMVYDGDAGAGHSPFEYAETAIDYYMNVRGIPSGRLMLGLPFYARPDWTDYRVLVSRAPEVVPFQNEFEGNHYNGLDLIEKKTRFALEQELGGVMAWEIYGDAPGDASLLNRIIEVLSEQP